MARFLDRIKKWFYSFSRKSSDAATDQNTNSEDQGNGEGNGTQDNASPEEKQFFSDDPESIRENIRRARSEGMERSDKKSNPSKDLHQELSTDNPKPPAKNEQEVVSKKNKKSLASPVKKVKKRRVRRFFYRFVISVLFIIHLLFAAIYFILSPSLVEEQIIKNFNSMSNGSIALKVKKINPLTGILIEDLEIKNGPDFEHSSFVKIKKIHISYSLPAFLWLNINIPEIGIYSPHIRLEQRKGVWNFATLMKASEKKEEKAEKKPEEEKEKPAESPPEKIELPLALKVLFRFILEDFRIQVESFPHEKNPGFSAGMEGFNIKTVIDIPPTKELPLKPPTAIVSIFKKIELKVNEDKPLKVWYLAKDFESRPPLYMHFLTFLDRDSNSFKSRMKIGVVQAPLRLKRKIFAPLNFLVEHDLQYFPQRDELDLKYFKVSFKDKDWINLVGKISRVQTEPDIQISMHKSDIVLDDIYPYYLSFTGDRSMRFAGKISLKPLTIIGTPQDLKIDGAVNLYNVRAKVPGLKWIYISRFHLDYHTKIYGNNPLYFRIDNLYAFINQSSLTGRVYVNLYRNMPAGPLFVLFKMNNLRPENFINAGVRGPLNFSLKSSGKQGLRNLLTSVDLSLNNFYYSVNESYSRPTNISAKVDVLTSLSANMKHVDLDLKKIYFSMANRNKKDAVRLSLNGGYKVDLKNIGPFVKGELRMQELYFNQMNLFDTYPDALRGNASRSEQPLKDPVTMSGKTGLNMQAKKIAADGEFLLKVPTFDVEDIRIGFDVFLDQAKQLTLIKDAFVRSPSKHLKVNVSGRLAPKSVYNKKSRKYEQKVVPQIKAAVALHSPRDSQGKAQVFTVYKTPDGARFNIGGDIDVSASVADQDVNGSVQIKDFEFNDGALTKVDRLNMNFPYNLRLDYDKKISKLNVTQEDILKNFNFQEKPNFTIRTVYAKHPARDKSYPYLKDFSALMFIRDNTFELKKMSATILDGQLIGQDILFFLGNLDPKQMQYQLKMNLINIDMAALDQTLVAKQKEGGLLSAFVNIAGTDPAAVDPRGYIIVNKIGTDIADQVMRALNEKEGKSKLGIAQPIAANATVPQSFEFRLGDGNVYPKVKLYRKALALAADLHPTELRYSRIPIQEFVSGLK